MRILSITSIVKDTRDPSSDSQGKLILSNSRGVGSEWVTLVKSICCVRAYLTENLIPRCFSRVPRCVYFFDCIFTHVRVFDVGRMALEHLLFRLRCRQHWTLAEARY